MNSIFFILLAYLMFIADLSAQTKNDDIAKIEKVLQLFKSGYSERDTLKAAEWCEKLFFENVEIIGTYSIHPNSMEWFSGRERAVPVFKKDWIAWGDLKVNLETANIGVSDNVAWVSFESTVIRSPKNSRGRTADESAKNILKYIGKLSDEGDKTSKLKLMESAYYANLILYQYEQGEEFIWPIRISGVLQKKEGIWKFRQMHFSHPNRGFPNVRN